MIKLRPNQIQPVQKGIDFFKEPSAVPSIIVAPTAAGKSIIIAKIVEGIDDKVLILQPSVELLNQNFSKYSMIGGKASIYSASAGQKNIGNVTYATIGSIVKLGHQFKAQGFTKLIIDECFIAGTLIDGKPIENLKIGDLVSSYNHTNNRIEVKKVISVFKNKTKSELLEFKFTNGKSFVCTPNHPLFTKEFGYISAKEVYLQPTTYTLLYDNQSLQELRNRVSNTVSKLSKELLHSKVSFCINENDYRKQSNKERVSILQEHFLCKTEVYKKEILQQELCGFRNKKNHKDHRNKMPRVRKRLCFNWGQKKIIPTSRLCILFGKMFSSISLWSNSGKKTFNTNEKKQPNVDAWSQREGYGIKQMENIPFSWGKWREYKTSNNDAPSNWIGNGIPNSYSRGKAFIPKCSKLLQGRFSLSRSEAINRSRWQNSQIKEMEVLGQKENGNIEFVRVDSCKVYKRGGRSECSEMCEESYVYNIEVEGNHNYFANGILVHNCDRYPREENGMLNRFIVASGITHVLGLTATPLKLQNNLDQMGNTFSKLVMLTSKSKKGQFFKEIIHVTQVSEMVKAGFWSKLEYEQYTIDERGLKYNSTKADYTEESLKAVYESNNITAKIIQKIKDIPQRKSIIVFVPSVKEAITLSGLIPNSVAVYGDMGKKEREHAVNFFKKGMIRVCINVNVLSVGFDHPELDAIICARPTASLAWLYQALGRGTRIHPNKKDCLIVDFSGNVRKFGRIEYLTFVKENIWKLYGEGNKLLTGIPLHTIGEHTKETENAPKKILMPFGKHEGKEIKDIDKNYRNWMLQNFTWNYRTMKIKKEIERLNAVV